MNNSKTPDPKEGLNEAYLDYVRYLTIAMDNMRKQLYEALERVEKLSYDHAFVLKLAERVDEMEKFQKVFYENKPK